MALPKNKPDLQEDPSVPAARPKEEQAVPVPADLAIGAAQSPARALQAHLENELTIGSPAPVRRIAVAILVLALACSFAAVSLFGYTDALSA